MNASPFADDAGLGIRFGGLDEELQQELRGREAPLRL
jgi:hypothetical protein